MTLDLDKFLVRDLTGLVFPQGETVASIGWIQLPVRDGKPAYDDEGRVLETGEEQSMDYPAFVLGAPNYAGVDMLLMLLMNQEKALRVRLHVCWRPNLNLVELVFRCRDNDMIARGQAPRLMVEPLFISPGGESPKPEYLKAMRDAYNAPGCVLSLLNTDNGVAQNTLFTKLEGDKRTFLYRRIVTNPFQAKLKVG